MTGESHLFHRWSGLLRLIMHEMRLEKCQDGLISTFFIPVRITLKTPITRNNVAVLCKNTGRQTPCLSNDAHYILTVIEICGN